MKVFKNTKAFIKRQPLSMVFRPKRQFVAFCIGTAKSGTSSIAAMFSRFRSFLEPNSGELIREIIRSENNSRTRDSRLMAAFSRCDREHLPEMNSSQINGFYLKEIETLHPAAKYILTIRPCLNWLESFANHHYETRTVKVAKLYWHEYRKFRFGRYGYSFESDETAVEEAGLFPIEAYVHFWADYNNDMLARAPIDRTLIVKTCDLGHSCSKIERFLGLRDGSLDPGSSHKNIRTQKTFSVRQTVAAEYLEAVVARHCIGPLAKYAVSTDS